MPDAVLRLARKDARALICVAIIFATTPVFAGMEMKFVCHRCGFSGKYGTGGGFFFEELPAFCDHENHFVSIAWDRGKSRPKPIRVDATGPLFVCPKCHTPTARPWDERHCPKCGSTRIATSGSGLFYD